MKPKGKLIAHKDSIEYRQSHGESHRYDVYMNWDFFWNSSFLDLPIREWHLLPDVLWAKDERGLQFLWLYFHWEKTYRYVERAEWISRQRYKKMDDIHNQIIDNITLSRKN